MIRSNVMFCEPALGPLARALRIQHPEASVFDAPLTDILPSTICVLDTGEDVKTIIRLADLLAASATSPRPQIIAQISDRRLQAAVEARLEQDRVEPRPIVVDAQAIVADHLISASALFKMAFWRDQPRVHVVMIGFSNLGRALLDEVILGGVADGLDMPLIDILKPDADATMAALSQEMPDIPQSATINCIELNADASHMLPGLLASVEKAAPVTAIFVLQDDAGEMLAASSVICQLQDRYQIALAPVFVSGPAAGAAMALITPRRSSHNLAVAINAIGGLADIDGLLDYVLFRRNVVGRRIHDSYEKQHARQTAGGTPWSELSETYRRANRRAARHLSQKLFMLGVEADAETARAHLVSPETFDRLIRPLVQSDVEDDVVRRLARLEHERWCADRRLDGWVHGDVRDDLRRRHPSLISFDDPRLTAVEIEKDIEQLRFLLGSVVLPEDQGAAVRLVVGIVDESGGQPGLAHDAVCARLDEEPDRDIILMSPLLTPGEFCATWTLVDHLDGRARSFRLFIPQQRFSGEVPATAAACDGRLDELLARADTYVVPIGSIEASAVDKWEDSEADAATHRALVNYVMRHCDAVISTRPREESLQTSNLPA